MIRSGINFFEYCEALRGFPEVFIFEVRLENFLNHCYGFLLRHDFLLKCKVINISLELIKFICEQ